jgi:hypothetical protein
MPLLAPVVVAPLSQCSPGVRVQGQLTGATVTLYQNGVQVGSGTAGWSDQNFDLAANVTLVPGAQVTARQAVGAEISPESSLPVVVQAKPATLGYVGIKTHLYVCGLCALLDGVVPGATIEVTVNGVSRGGGIAYDGSAQVGFTQPTAPGEILEARQTACGTPGPVTTLPTPDPPPAPEGRRLTPPTVNAPLRECQRAVTVSGVFDGSRVTLLQSGRPPEAGNFVVDSEYFRVSPLTLGESITASQAYPSCGLASVPSSPAVVAGPAQPVTAPTVSPPLCAGSVTVTLSGLFVGSPVRIYQNGVEIGEGEAPAESFAFQVPPLLGGAAITASQELCSFWSPPSGAVTVNPRPAFLPAPVIPGPLYACATVVHVEDLHPGSTVYVWSTMLDAPIGSQQVYATEWDIPVSPQLIGPHGSQPGDRIYAQEIGCGLTVESQHVAVQAMPRLALPIVEPPVDACMRSVTVANVVPGANVDVYVNDAWRGTAAAGVSPVEVPIQYGPLNVGDSVAARQRMCDSITALGKPTPVVSPVGLNYTTRHFDIARTGWNPYEKTLNVGNAGTVHELFSHALDGQAYAQPLYLHHVLVPGQGVHNMVFVATENDSVYAFDADTQQPALWQTSLIPPGESVVPSGDIVGQSNVWPVIGITSTPVIDCSAYTMYVVAKTKAVSSPTFLHRLHALDISTGAERPGSPVEIPGSISYPGTGDPNDGHGNVLFSTEFQLNRPALLLLNGTLYIAFGSHNDYPLQDYHGWVLAYDASSLAHIATFNTTPSKNPTEEAGGIWQSGGGLAGDSEGFIYCATGNGQFDANTGGPDYGDSVLRLTPGLTVNSYYTPGNQQELEPADKDLGSGAVLVLPDNAPGSGTHPYMLVACGKDGWIFLLDRHNMGGYTGPAPAGTDPQAIQTLQLIPGATGYPGVWGGPAYYGGPDGSLLYYCGDGSKLKAFELNGGQLAQAMVGGNPSESPGIFDSSVANGGTFPVVSSDQQVPGTGVVWAIRRINPLRLQAFDATNLTSQLLDVQAGAWNSMYGGAFLEPTVINGKIYVGSDGLLTVFGT